jgi:8-oxo-dGTP pyrophosphatase MutT (NUDIX family)
MKKLLQKVGTLAWWVTLPALRFYLSRTPRTRAVLQSGGKTVVVKGWLGSGRWALPGGGLHRGEEPLAGVIREVHEETGIVLQPAQMQSLGVELYRNHGIHFQCHYFAVELPEQLPLVAQLLEISDLAWMPSGTLTAKNANPDVLGGLRLAAAKSTRGNLLQ